MSQEHPNAVIRPQSFDILPQSHTASVRIEHFIDHLPFVNRQTIAEGVQARLVNSHVRSLTLHAYEFSPDDLQFLTDQTISMYATGAFVPRDAAQLLRKELRQFSARAGIVATGGVDNLIAPQNGTYPRIMRATDGVEIAMANGLIPKANLRVFGPAARPFSEEVPIAEIFDALVFAPTRQYVRRQVSKAKALSLDEIGTVHMSDTPNLQRGILTHHTWLARQTKETNPAEQPFVLAIAGGDGTHSLEDAIQAELTARGISNASWTIHAQGEDLVVKGAVIREMPDAKGVRDLTHLQELQQPLLFTGGSMTIIGSMTPHHPDGALFTQTGLRYTRHEHGIGQSPDNIQRGGHINATILGEHSVAYVIIRPIAHVVEVDASLTTGTRMEAMKLPQAASYTQILETISLKIMGNEVITHATQLGLNASQVADLFTLTRGNMIDMMDIMDSTSFRMNLLVQQLEHIRRSVAESRQLLAQIHAD